MTVGTTNAVNTYTANGVQTVFNFTYQIIEDQNGNPQTSTVAVYVNGVLQNSGFTTSANADQEDTPGGSVTFTTPPVNGAIVELLRNTPPTQNLTFPLEAKISTPALETAFDKTCLLVQEAEYQLSLKPNYPQIVNGGLIGFGTTGSPVTVNPNTAGFLLVDNGPGNPPSFQPGASGSAGGNVVGPTPAINTAGSVPLWGGIDGRTLAGGAPPVQTGNLFVDNGPGNPPSFQVAPANIVQLGGSSGGPKPLLNVPTNVAVANVGTAGTTQNSYKVTAQDSSGGTITAASAVVNNFTGNATLNGTNYNKITWNAVPGAVSYNVYRTVANGTPSTTGKIANVTATTYNDQGAAGDSSTAPTSTTLTGEYWHAGTFTTDAPIIANRVRIHLVGGNFVQSSTSHTITVNTDLAGGPIATVIYGLGGDGQGIGGGQGATTFYNGTAAIASGGAGGANGGNGGKGGSLNTDSGPRGAIAYHLEHQLPGSGGGAGAMITTAGGAGGAGGGAFMIETSGNITLVATMTANGTNGTAGTGADDAGGGAGSGGTILLVCAGNLSLANTVTLTANGGTGGNGGTSTAAAGGGGGGGRIVGRCAGTLTNNCTTSVTGGAAGTGTGSPVAAGAGSAGMVDISAQGYFVRTAP